MRSFACKATKTASRFGCETASERDVQPLASLAFPCGDFVTGEFSAFRDERDEGEIVASRAKLIAGKVGA